MDNKPHHQDKSHYQEVSYQDNLIRIEMDANFFFERALRYLDRNNYDKALKYFQRAVDQEPNNAVNHANLAGVMAEMGYYEDSNDILERILEDIDPTFTEAFFYMANNWAHLEEYELAEEYALRYLEEDNEGEYRQDAEELLSMLEPLLGRPVREMQPSERVCLFQIHDKARLMLESGRFAEATELLERILNEAPDFLAARNNLTLAYYYQGDLERAMRMVETVLSVEPGNVHALCNLVVLYEQLGEKAQLSKLLATLKKLVPIQAEQLFKLATTLGISGEHEGAYQLFNRLIRLGMTDDVSIYHYAAVAAANTGRLQEAVKGWKKAMALDSSSPVPLFYLRVMEDMLEMRKEDAIREEMEETTGERKDEVKAPDVQVMPAFAYQYELPYEEQLKRLAPHTLREMLREPNPWLRSALHWGLKTGDYHLKLQVLQALGFIADQESAAMLKAFLLKPGEPDYLKKVAVFVLRYMGVEGPFEVVFNGRRVRYDALDEPIYAKWASQCQTVLACVKDRLNQRYEEIYTAEAQSIWINFLTSVYPHLPHIRKVSGWSAALEYLTLKNLGEEVTQRQVADSYGVSTTTLSKNAHLIQRHVKL